MDHNMEGQAVALWGTLASTGWLDLLALRLVRFAEAGLPVTSDDRAVWRFAQAGQMLLLTNNRNRRGPDSLTQTIEDETTAETLPVLTVSDLDRMTEPDYRRRCAERLAEIVLDLALYRGAGRLFLP